MAKHLMLVLSCVILFGAGSGWAQDKPKVESIDFRKLKEWMPEEAGGLKRSEVSGERNKAGEISISQARANYKKNDEDTSPRIEITVIDYSSTELGAAMAATWTAVEIDKESDDGIERTVKIGGNPGMLTWQKDGKHGNLQLVVGKRYLITMQSDNIPWQEIPKIAEKLPLAKLAELK